MDILHGGLVDPFLCNSLYVDGDLDGTMQRYRKQVHDASAACGDSETDRDGAVPVLREPDELPA